MSTELFERNHVTSAAIQDALLQTDFADLELYASGKVRDVYRVDNDHLLFVATDRISAFDYVLGSGIPNKGKVLTQISLFWFDFLKDVVANHVVTANVDEYPAPLRKYSDQLRGRSMLVVRANMCPVECVVRGYLSGSGWKEYQATGAVCGIELPKGLRESDRLPHPIFTPATKATTGHDENISFAEMKKLAGPEVSEKLRDLSLKVYEKASAHAAKCGILIADTKFEFGTTEAGVVLADEVLTPDSSRFWPADKYSPGAAQFSYDKQFVRDYLEQIKWDKRPPAPALPPDVVAKTSEKYVEAFRLLTGRELET
ncbi:MAG TPA: phosphoribosylaminoimidazolesuccinocarboxamide synthase [Terriglobales bacterium]|nr:phosphoribosylaminoimidazolesuccinocarboxamide synthase [Terriglobales bacterium]